MVTVETGELRVVLPRNEYAAIEARYGPRATQEVAERGRILLRYRETLEQSEQNRPGWWSRWRIRRRARRMGGGPADIALATVEMGYPDPFDAERAKRVLAECSWLVSLAE